MLPNQTLQFVDLNDLNKIGSLLLSVKTASQSGVSRFNVATLTSMMLTMMPVLLVMVAICFIVRTPGQV